ncbi:XisI protein [Leptolyngbya cf. ectocarpi LEGE 11479]|uniref:XisI protein n=1 Tax=Leptolyngbya cf. ectocarpi LEGE 11479 TaxID=1828722 RepID=A0A929FD00_LEPEC|nr:XisI protein [Leptolyngbya ectocarpi]MBE9070597.1 XisI protein [Leptolyngbya cf. ectocarpi LEGE 11479]
MDTMMFYQNTVEKILKDYAEIPYSYGDIRQYVIVDAERTHFLLFNEGWNGKKRVHGVVTHVEIRDSKLWIHFDGTEDGITDELVTAGISKENIVLAFHPPQVRQHTGYAIA